MNLEIRNVASLVQNGIVSPNEARDLLNIAGPHLPEFRFTYIPTVTNVTSGSFPTVYPNVTFDPSASAGLMAVGGTVVSTPGPSIPSPMDLEQMREMFLAAQPKPKKEKRKPEPELLLLDAKRRIQLED